MTRGCQVLAGAAMVGGLCAALAAQQPAPSFRSSVDAVFVPVSVTDRNRPVTGLTAADFDLVDNGVAQIITAAPVESLPLDVTLVLDTSGSVKGPALEQFKADVQDIAESMQTNDRVRLITFATSVTDVFGLHPGGDRLPVERIEAGGATSFYNALAAALMAFPQAERPQLIFGFTDGLDNMSFVDARQVATLAGHSGASLYLALIAPDERVARRMAPYDGGPNRRVLQEAVAGNGGALYEKPAGTPLPAFFRQVLDDFRSSYVLSYAPRGVTSKGWHEVVVHTRNSRYSVRARQGYDGG